MFSLLHQQTENKQKYLTSVCLFICLSATSDLTNVSLSHSSLLFELRNNTPDLSKGGPELELRCNYSSKRATKEMTNEMLRDVCVVCADGDV